jgi:hypothetical protein
MQVHFAKNSLNASTIYCTPKHILIANILQIFFCEHMSLLE